MDLLKNYGMSPFAIMRLTKADEITVDITDDNVAAVQRGIYAWEIGNEIARIGSSKNTLRSRIVGTGRWITMRLQGITQVSDSNRVKAELQDASRWKKALLDNGNSAVAWGRLGTIAKTDIGEINVYLAEENYLLERHKPPLNNSHFR